MPLFLSFQMSLHVGPQRDRGSVGHVDVVSQLTSWWEELKL